MKQKLKDKYFAANDNCPIDEDQHSSSPYARDLELRGWQTAAIKRREDSSSMQSTACTCRIF
ncbi:hypothetical protein [Ochrobactrum teleogrylli]